MYCALFKEDRNDHGSWKTHQQQQTSKEKKLLGMKSIE
jgi:hypothetical protein